MPYTGTIWEEIVWENAEDQVRFNYSRGKPRESQRSQFAIHKDFII